MKGKCGRNALVAVMELEPDPAHSQRPPPKNFRPPSKRASTSRGGTIGKHFKLKKQLTRKKSLDKMIGQLETYSKEIRGAKTKRRRSSGSSSTKRNCGSYFLRPLPQKNYSQFTFTI